MALGIGDANHVTVGQINGKPARPAQRKHIGFQPFGLAILGQWPIANRDVGVRTGGDKAGIIEILVAAGDQNRDDWACRAELPLLL